MSVFQSAWKWTTLINTTALQNLLLVIYFLHLSLFLSLRHFIFLFWSSVKCNIIANELHCPACKPEPAFMRPFTSWEKQKTVSFSPCNMYITCGVCKVILWGSIENHKLDFYGLTCEGTALGHGAAIFFNLESGTFKLLVFVLKGGLLHDICLLCTGSYHLAAYTGGT